MNINKCSFVHRSSQYKRIIIILLTYLYISENVFYNSCIITNSVKVLSAQSALVPYVIILQLYPNEIGCFPFPAQCTSAVLTHTTVVSERLSHFAGGVLEQKWRIALLQQLCPNKLAVFSPTCNAKNAA